MLAVMQTNLSEAARALGQRGAAIVNQARSPERRSEIARRAARARWGLCLKCGSPAGTHSFDCGFEKKIAFAGLDGPGDTPPETTP